MNKFTFLAVASVALVAMAIGSAMAGITGSKHDLTTGGWGATKICEPCHTPHNADTTVLDAPLWNHALTTQTFSLYSSSTLDATMGQPTGVSKLCLSCHDGVTAVFGGTVMTGNHVVGSDLSDDHPVGFTFDAALSVTDPGLFDPTVKTVAQLGGGTIDGTMLFSGKVECASCHDVHDNTNNDFLRFANTNSALCLTCHNK